MEVGLAAEYAVASELCRRGYLAQVTLGNQKRADILLLNDNTRKFLKVEVKGKKNGQWANVTGIFGDNALLVLVDFWNKNDLMRPDFYILTVDDWKLFAQSEIDARPATEANKDAHLNENNVPVWPNQIKKNGTPQTGISFSKDKVSDYIEKWDKVDNAV